MSSSYVIPSSIYLLIKEFYPCQDVNFYDVHINKNNCIDSFINFFIGLRPTDVASFNKIESIISSLQQRKSAINDIYNNVVRNMECCV